MLIKSSNPKLYWPISLRSLEFDPHACNLHIKRQKKDTSILCSYTCEKGQNYDPPLKKNSEKFLAHEKNKPPQKEHENDENKDYNYYKESLIQRYYVITRFQACDSMYSIP